MGKFAEALELKPIERELATDIAEDICWRLINSGTVEKVEIAGSIRRQVDKPIADIDIQTIPFPDILGPIEWLKQQRETKQILRQGSNIISVLWEDGAYPPVVVDLYLTTEDSWYAHLMFLTGSAKLNIRHRSVAKRRGWMLSQNGLFNPNGELVKLKSEKQAYDLLGFTWHEPWDRDE